MTIIDTYRLSPVQEGMLYDRLATAERGLNLQQIVCILREEIDVSAFARAWRRVVARHPALRTSFRWDGLAEPRQEVHDDAELAVELLDWRDHPEGDRERRFDAFLHADRTRGLELTEAPLARLAMIQFGDREHRCVWTFHHMLLDGRSYTQVLDEVFAVFEGLRASDDPKLDEARPYREYVEWLDQPQPEGATAFWREQLAGFSAPTALIPSTPDRRADDEPALGAFDFHLSEAVTEALSKQARDGGYTLNTLVQGAWALLLARYSGEDDVIFGATRAARRTTFEGAEAIVGLFINTLPVRARVAWESPATEWLQELRRSQQAVRAYEHSPLADVQRCSDVAPGVRLFESVLIFDNYLLGAEMRRRGDAWAERDFYLLEQTGYPLTLYAYAEAELIIKITFERDRFSSPTVARMLGHLRALLESLAADPTQTLADLSFVTPEERELLLTAWNETAVHYRRDATIHQLVEEQAQRTPDRVAVAFRHEEVTYSDLNARANRLARHLRGRDVGPDRLVGLYLERSVEMVVALLATLKAGGAYVPLDPTYPDERVALMIEDSGCDVLLTSERLLEQLPQHNATVICVDRDAPAFAAESADDLAEHATPGNLAYVIYTSGSTGRPKGVMVEHRNAVNFFAGMDAVVPHDPPGVWLSVTSLSFDISVLELLWTLTHGFTVVLYTDEDRTGVTEAASESAVRPMDFSLFFWGGDGTSRDGDKYGLLLEASTFADEHGFTAVWTPERHFHGFGGLYPNPSLTSAAVAAITQRVQIRSGSVVMALHHPARVAEEWAVVDNLSNGRVGISFASGWMPNDFALMPANYEQRRELTFRGVDEVRRLWRGEAVEYLGGTGELVAIETYPRPVQAELPVWITSGGSIETFRRAGAIGASLLTHLLGQKLDAVEDKIRAYRQAWQSAGHGPGRGHVTMMLHTLVGEDVDAVREDARAPMKGYLASSMDLVRDMPWAWPDFGSGKGGESLGRDPLDLSEEDAEALLDFAFERYFETSGLFGTVESCLPMVDSLRKLDVDELACLVDFGVPAELLLPGLEHLNRLRRRSNANAIPAVADYSIPALVTRHGVTHLQCTPSQATMLVADDETRAALGRVQTLLIGGEAFPAALASELVDATDATIINMYGPTETTVWSSTERVRDGAEKISIGRPIANTQLYILDRWLRPTPIGVAGELCIGGDGVVRGYHQRPDLTAERFIADPFSDPGARMYRTGDLARYLEDGRVEFLGRLDSQIKLRGHRIELGEIEVALQEHPEVREAVLLAREDEPGDTRMVAYVVPRDGSTPTADALRAYLRERLPDFMIPQHFLALDEFPHTPNQKIDRKALPAPESGYRPGQPTDGAARTPTEKTLAQIWSEILGATSVGVHDDFFELGGHSLIAMRLIARVREIAGVDVSLKSLFTTPTIAGFAATLDQLQIAQADEQRLASALSEMESLTEEEVSALIEQR